VSARRPAQDPLLRVDLAIVEQIYRSEQSFVVKDGRTQAYYRFRPVEMRVMRMFDGRRSASAIAEALTAEGVHLSPATVDRFARKLTRLGLLEATLLERTTQQLERLRNERRRKGSFVRGELLRMRFSFGDPTPLLGVVYPWVRWCFSRGFVVASLALFAAYVAIVGTGSSAYVDALAAWFSLGALTPWTIALLVLSFCALTFVHEMGHAVACRHFGGEVREMGFMFLLFIPAFYANVTDAWSFPGRRERLWVTFAGPWIELAVTSVVAIVWLFVPPGSVAAQCAVAVILVGGIGNIVTNFNPLLPLDGYFALGDWLEIPNLRHRARDATIAWVRRRLLRVDEAEEATDPRERRILLRYGAASAVYSTGFLLLLGGRAVATAGRTLGALAAALVVLALLAVLRAPLRMVAAASRGAMRRRRASPHAHTRWRWASALGAVVLLAAVVPCSLTTDGTFTVTPGSSLAVMAPASGVIGDVFVREGDAVAAGAPLLRVDDYALSRELVGRTRVADSLAFGVARARAAVHAAVGEVLEQEARSAAAVTDEARARLASMLVHAGATGVVATPRPERLIGQRVALGDTLLVLDDLSRLDATVHVSGPGAAEVHPGQAVRLMSPANGGHAITGVVDAISVAAGEAGALEARVRLDPASGLRAGAVGDARVVRGPATLLTALAWAVRHWIRSDLLL
jgi:putative peptide zinc metalloprotease protein